MPCVAAQPAATPPAAQSTPTTPTAPIAPKRNIGGPGDYAIREKMIEIISRDEDLSKQKIKIILVNGGAVFSGEIKHCALKKRLLTMAAEMRGVINVTDEMTVPRGEVTDEELAKAVIAQLKDAAESLGLKDLDVQVSDGVATLQGTVKDFVARGHSEDIAGSVLGLTRIVNHLQSADAPSGTDDASLLKAVIAYLNNIRVLAYRNDLTVKVSQGVVTLKGRAPLFLPRQQAGLAASLVKGVVRVDNRIKIDPSVMVRENRVQAEK